MQQLRLFMDEICFSRTISFESISAIFTAIGNNMYEVILEVNSNKFLIHFWTAMNKIEKFEIIAVKGFVDVSVSILRTIKKIIYKLYFEY